MANILDTPFETALRVLLMLSVSPKNEMSADLLAIADTFAIYGGRFGITEENLHGGDRVFDEYDAKRELVKEAVKMLVLRGLIDARQGADGFRYAINEVGAEYTALLVSEYANMYRESAGAVHGFINGKTERELFDMIIRSNAAFERKGPSDD